MKSYIRVGIYIFLGCFVILNLAPAHSAKNKREYYSTKKEYSKPYKKQYNSNTKCYPYDKYYHLRKSLPYQIPLFLIVSVGVFFYIQEKRTKSKHYDERISKLSKIIDGYEEQLDIKCLNQKERQKAGQEYEKYVARHFRRKGYKIEMVGIEKGLEDEGIDLVGIKKNSPIVLIQCKNWSSDKIIHEKHIFELYGAQKYYENRNNVKTEAILYSTCDVSQKAKKIAQQFNIKIVDGFKMLNK